MLTLCASDGKTPQEQTSQILAVAPILPKHLQSKVGGNAASQQSSTASQQTATLPIRGGPSAHAAPTSPAPDQEATTSRHHEAAQSQNAHDTNSAKLKRQDSLTAELDEFVDAKD